MLLREWGCNFGFVIGRATVFKAAEVVFGLFPSPGSLGSVLWSWYLTLPAGKMPGSILKTSCF